MSVKANGILKSECAVPSRVELGFGEDREVRHAAALPSNRGAVNERTKLIGCSDSTRGTDEAKKIETVTSFALMSTNILASLTLIEGNF